MQLEDGLYTGETILHIAIVQEQEKVVQRLLENGINISSRALGVFFQPRFQQPRTSDLTFQQRLKARIIGVDLTLEKFAAVKRIENTHSGCYYGEYPLSFAASVGNVEICDLLYCCWQRRIEAQIPSVGDGSERLAVSLKMTDFESQAIKNWNSARQDAIAPESDKNVTSATLFKSKTFESRNPNKNFSINFDESELRKKSLMRNFVNAADSFGNTAMHMAVMHSQKHVIDWLMKLDEGKDSMELINHEGFTPLTLAARHGKVEVFHHILYQHMSETAWTYGKVSPLAPNFRLETPEPTLFGADVSAPPRPEVRLRARWIAGQDDPHGPAPGRHLQEA